MEHGKCLEFISSPLFHEEVEIVLQHMSRSGSKFGNCNQWSSKVGLVILILFLLLVELEGYWSCRFISFSLEID